MMRADLVIFGAAELVTCAGPGEAAAGADSPLTGPAQADPGVIRDGAIACEGDRIVWVGPTNALDEAVSPTPWGRRISADGCTVLPGLVDAHTHLPFAGWREADWERRLRGESYADIARSGGGIMTTVRATRAASEEELAALAGERLDRMLRHGTTTVEAKSGYGLTVGEEMKQLDALAALSRVHPIEIVPTLLGAHVVPEEFSSRRADYVRLVIEEMIPAAASEGLASFCDAFVENGAFTPEEARAILEAGARVGLRSRVHAEQLGRSGGAALAAAIGAASADHLEHASAADAAALAAAGTVAVLLPGANLFAGGVQGAPGRMLVDAGVPVAVASDFNPGTCPCESVAAMVPLACLLCGLTPDEAIVAVTRNAAASLGRAGSIGALAPGMQADIAIFEVPDRRHLAYRFGTNRCTGVVKKGVVVVEPDPARG